MPNHNIHHRYEDKHTQYMRAGSLHCEYLPTSVPRQNIAIMHTFKIPKSLFRVSFFHQSFSHSHNIVLARVQGHVRRECDE
jgi:hypothetical protein